MDDTKLLDFYLNMYSSEAAPWNLSPQSLYIQMEIRDWFSKEIKLPSKSLVCNIGIGVGDWDEYLGYYLNGNGIITSIDIDEDICTTFLYRQSREGHPNPSKVVCEDFLKTTLPEHHFDLVTIIGSTLGEIGDFDKTFDNIVKILKPNGKLFHAGFKHHYPQSQFENYIMRNGAMVVKKKEKFDRFPSVEFYTYLVEKI
ncbi:methyltransferase domain-containing protein [Paenibacillus donghaensis]|nr:methyltransferase domain-containing protein [Paenibacillus donghaensis]